jgi:hypothetical protein
MVKSQESSSFLCSFYPGGESLPDPNQLVPSGDGTSGELSTIVISFTSQICQEQQAALTSIIAIAVACGCGCLNDIMHVYFLNCFLTMTLPFVL